MIKQLQTIGLSKEEAKIYLAVLALGKCNLPELCEQSDYDKNVVEQQINNLKQKGLLKIELENKRLMFVAEKPNKLFDLTELKQKEKISVMPRLDFITKEMLESPNVCFLNSDKIINLWNQEIKKEKTNEVFFMGRGVWFKKLFSKKLEGFLIKVNFLCLDKQDYNNTKVNFNKLEKRSLLLPGFKLSLGFLDGRIFCFKSGKNERSFIIDDRVLASGMKAVFFLLWEQAEKIS